jgi:hypothetical protein
MDEKARPSAKSLEMKLQITAGLLPEQESRIDQS